jgi:hypothetical protein
MSDFNPFLHKTSGYQGNNSIQVPLLIGMSVTPRYCFEIC